MSTKPELSGAEREREIRRLARIFPEPIWGPMRKPPGEGPWRVEWPRRLREQLRAPGRTRGRSR